MQSTQPIHKAKGITLRLLIVTAFLLLSLFVFLGIADAIVLKHNDGFDTSIFQKLSFLTSPFTTRLMLFFTFFGSDTFLFLAYTLLVAYFLFIKKSIKVSLGIAAIGIFSKVLLVFTKRIFKRQRPLDPLIPNVTGYSFPSGHAFYAFTFFGLIIYLLWQSEIRKRRKYLLSIAFILFASCVAFSRVYLHVHYASDVIGSFYLSMSWLAISLWLLSKINV